MYGAGPGIYGAGPGIIAGGVAQGSHGFTQADGAHGLLNAPRHSQSQQRHPTALLVSINTAVSTKSFFMIHISNRNILVSSGSFHQVNSTPRFVMCKCNLRVFSETRPLPICYA